jgi:beta-glucanase (GH16 family)
VLGRLANGTIATKSRVLVLVASAVLAAFVAALVVPGGSHAAREDGWTLVWHDEFDGAANTSPDSSKWTYDTGNLGVNSELENYTNRTSNVRLNGNGQLEIVARNEKLGGWDYTSGRILTKGLFATTYGRIEARIRIPYGQGIWPAFWMLGSNIGTVGWPQCGEVDIMENIGREPAVNHGSAHGPGYSGGSALTASYTLASGRLADDYHVYALEWSPEALSWSVDGNVYEMQKRGSQPIGSAWVYDHPFFLLLNVAVGGDWPGDPNASTTFPQTMSVDYVRVYKPSGPDTVPPTMPQLHVAHVTPHGATLAWSASADESGVAGYDVYRGRTKLGTTKTTSFGVRGLAPATRYSFAVRARDKAGNLSPLSNAVTVRTCKAGRKSC